MTQWTGYNINFKKSHTMKMYGGVGVQCLAFLTLKLDGGEWSTSHPSCFVRWLGG